MERLHEKPFLEHLQDLRGGLVRAVSCTVLFAGAALFWSSHLWKLLLDPLNEAGATLVNLSPGEGLLADFDACLMAGLVLSIPVWLWEAWRFLAPGLYRRERPLVAATAFASLILALSGAWFAWKIALPLALEFLSGYGSIHAQQLWNQASYISFVFRTLGAMALAFQLPVILFALARLGLVDAGFLLRQARTALFLLCVVAAVLSPPDIASMAIFAAPLCLLYAIGIIVVWFAAERRT